MALSERALNDIATDAAHLRDALQDSGFGLPAAQQLVVAAMPAIIADCLSVLEIAAPADLADQLIAEREGNSHVELHRGTAPGCPGRSLRGPGAEAG
jgi:hypothetical protein